MKKESSTTTTNCNMAGLMVVALLPCLLGAWMFFTALHSQKKSENTGTLELGIIASVKYVEFDGHQYVHYSDGYWGSLCHSPKCPCMEKSTEGK